jgi:hypothetical protein
MRRKHRSVSRRLRLVLPVFIATFVATGVAVSPAASAHDGHDHAAHVTFTKWIVTEPANPPSFAGVLMSGVVGGDVGKGRYVGTVLGDNLNDPGFWHARALYGFFGHQHAFVAKLRITENDTTDPATATLRGTVLAGWRDHQAVRGVYTVMDPCPLRTPGNVEGRVCFQGKLTIGAAGSH